MKIEDKIPAKERLKQGIFFTKDHIVSEIEEQLSFTNVRSVIDSAAGSCNFLIPLAKKYPHIQFYGIEKNQYIYEEVLEEIREIPNISYYHGDAILDDFPIPKCDLYLGNPPFINFSDLDESYRKQIRPYWLEYFPNSKGFKMLLGSSRGDIAQLIFTHTVHRYLKDGGLTGVILPNSLIKGNSATAGFREFYNLKVEKIVDIGSKEAFDNTNRACFYIMAQKGESTTYPITYIQDGQSLNLIKIGTDLIEEGISILGTSSYTARQGINTLGANEVFFFKKEVPFKSELIWPLLKSSDILPFSCRASYFILYPYDKSGKLIPEDILQKKYPQEYNYLIKHRPILEKRKSRFAQKHWYGLFGVGEYTSRQYKVVWRGLGAKELMAAVTEHIIPNQAMNCYISTKSAEEAHFICAIMNSEIYKEQLLLLNEQGAKSFAQPATINKIFIPLFDPNSEIHRKISNYSIKLHKSYNEAVYEELDECIRSYYRTLGFTL